MVQDVCRVHADAGYIATDLAGNKLSVAYWENRLGALAASQLPLITLLGTKNNALSCEYAASVAYTLPYSVYRTDASSSDITGVSYDRVSYIS